MFFPIHLALSLCKHVYFYAPRAVGVTTGTRRAGGHIEHALNHLENLAADPLTSRGDVLANLRDAGDDEAEGDGAETMRGGDTRHV